MTPKIAKEFADLQQQLVTKVMGGTCTPEEYHHLCGYYQGLRQAESVMINLSGEIDDQYD